MSLGHCGAGGGVNAKQPTWQWAQMFTGYQGTKASIFTMAWKGHHLSPHQNGFHSHLFSSKFSLFFACSPFESRHTFLAHANPQCPLLSSLNSSRTCCLNQKACTPHPCCKMQTGIACATLPPANRKMAPGRQEVCCLLAGQLGLLSSAPGTRTPSRGLPQLQLSVAFYPTLPQFRMGLGVKNHIRSGRIHTNTS